MSEQKKRLKYCCACEKQKSFDSFYTNPSYSDGLLRRCKICVRGKVKCKKKLPTGRPLGRNLLSLYCPTEEDWKNAYELLGNIGYSLDRSIHEQFCEKYNLKTKERPKERHIIFSPEDLDLI